MSLQGFRSHSTPKAARASARIPRDPIPSVARYQLLTASVRLGRPMTAYKLLYRLGITPWDRDEVPRPLIDFAERQPSPGRALDLGCGTGRDAVYLAKRGWTVSAVDFVPQAIESARRRAASAEVDVDWVLGDVTDLRELEPDSYSLVLDRGCFH